MGNLQWLKDQFIEHFNVNHIGIDLMNMCDEEKLYVYIIKSFAENFSYSELSNEYANKLDKEELKRFLLTAFNDESEIEGEEM